jgi:hypothetical protein
MNEEENKKILVNEEEHKINSLCYDLIEIGYLDLKSLLPYYECLKRFEDDISIIDLLNDMDLKLDTNNIYFVIIDKLFYFICNELENLEDIKKNELKNIEKLKDNFSPFINCLDSWFNNVFDELNLGLDKDELIEEARKLINKGD